MKKSLTAAKLMADSLKVAGIKRKPPAKRLTVAEFIKLVNETLDKYTNDPRR